MTKSCTKPPKKAPKGLKAVGEAEGITSDEWNVKLKREQYYKVQRENLLAEKKLIEIDIAVGKMSDLVSFVWLTAANLSNTLPARCENSTAEKIRAEIVNDLNAAKREVDEYLKGLK